MPVSVQNPNQGPEVPAQQAALNELSAQATTAEDQAHVAEWQREIDGERQAALGNVGGEVTKLAQLPDGTVTTAAEVEASRERGEEPTVAGGYGQSGRR